ncbi:TetR/AcrR family transcriptional regulator [Bifidobacterium simiarum]|uniref:TetR family transcriptional regulator n=1 Tax=Bifidobacterium simiarum TaxID=2045441 RepID=A0A2M9HCS0_9BIFI|nr:helix-turn-helix domain-containing protein [Bifidobacterium simiarum]PJM74591.1 TetR family transcriptional regulator [Bifidobacterium simiarum]
MVIRRRDRVRMDPHKRREQIVRVASELMAERGYWGTSLQEVADACGLTVAGLIHHVQSKTGLLMMILEQEDNRALVDISRQIDGAERTGESGGKRDSGDEDGPDRVQDMSFGNLSLAQACHVLVEYNARNPEKVRLYSMLDAEALDSTHPAYEWLRNREHFTLEVMRELAAKEPSVDDPMICARKVLALMDGLQLQWLRDSEHLDFVRMWKDVTASIPELRCEE